MNPVHPEFVPDASLARAEMEALQQEIAERAEFTDQLGYGVTGTAKLDEENNGDNSATEPRYVAGVDQAFDGETAVSAAVVFEDGEVIERTHAAEPLELPYIPGLLSFREGRAVLEALAKLTADPDVILVDGNGRIHYREAGLATHIGVTLDVATVGVAKSLLCGRPRDDLTDLPEGARVPIEADDEVTAPEGTVIGYAVQTRQYDAPNQHINPVYVSPGHRVSAETAADIVSRTASRYKLPEPVRQADQDATTLTS